MIASVEPRIAEATRQELIDQRGSLKLIASENYASPAVLLTMGTWFSDKYAEGTIGHRFYAGCQNVDTVEAIAAEHARELFGATYAYAQPHSGIDANLVAYWSILAHRVEGPWLEKYGAKNVNDLTDEDWEKLRHELGNQRLLGMSLDAGGHLTHGFRPNISGKMFHQQQYGTDPETGLLDYDKVAAKAREFKPLVLVAGYSAYPRRVNFAKMREIADEVGATLMVDMAHFAGLVAGKVFTGDEDPVPHAHITTTTTHKSLRGPRGGLVLATEEYAPSVDRGCPMVLGGPLSHIMAAKAVALAEARQDSFRGYAQDIADNAKSLAEGFLTRGANLVTGGTDNHIVLLDVSSFGLTGRQAESALLDAGVVTNRNSVPSDPNGAWYTSGIRLGTPALTTRGFGHDEFDTVAELIVHVLQNTQPGTTKDGKPSKASYVLAEGIADKVKDASAEMLDKHPLYPGLNLSCVAQRRDVASSSADSTTGACRLWPAAPSAVRGAGVPSTRSRQNRASSRGRRRVPASRGRGRPLELLERHGRSPVKIIRSRACAGAPRSSSTAQPSARHAGDVRRHDRLSCSASTTENEPPSCTSPTRSWPRSKPIGLGPEPEVDQGEAVGAAPGAGCSGCSRRGRSPAGTRPSSSTTCRPGRRRRSSRSRSPGRRPPRRRVLPDLLAAQDGQDLACQPPEREYPRTDQSNSPTSARGATRGSRPSGRGGTPHAR